MPRGRCLRLIGNQSLASLALSSASYGVIDAAVARGALLHDLGKANDQFQRMVRGDETIQALSALGNRWDRKQSGLVVVGLSEVAGNQSRFLYDFSPESVIFRWTDDFAPRLLYGFRLDGEQPQLREEVRRRIESDDIDAKDLIVGGSIASDSEFLKQKGAMVCAGVKEAAAKLKARIRSDLNLKDAKA